MIKLFMIPLVAIFSIALIILKYKILQKQKYKHLIKEIYTFKGRANHIAKLDLKTLISIYKINPKRFKYERPSSLCDYSHILYNSNQDTKKINNIIPGYISSFTINDTWEPNTTIDIILSFEDYKKFLKLLKYKSNWKFQELENEGLQYLIESAKVDIKKMQSQSKEEINSAIEIMKGSMLDV